MADGGRLLRAVRCSRRLSQRELAGLADVPQTTVGRIEAGRTSPRLDTFAGLLAAAGYEIAVCDRHGRLLTVNEERECLVDRDGRQFPAHLKSARTPDYCDVGSWWGWHNIAWPWTDDWVPENTYWRRRDDFWYLTGGDNERRELGRVWDDAT